jgi:hypothetical protein
MFRLNHSILALALAVVTNVALAAGNDGAVVKEQSLSSDTPWTLGDCGVIDPSIYSLSGADPEAKNPFNDDVGPVDVFIAADLTFDGLVNVDDLIRLLMAWGSCPEQTTCEGDIAPAGGDGAVDFNDLVELMSFWGIVNE